MPISLPVNQLEVGMCLASNIVNQFSVLLPHNHILTETDLEALNKRFPEKVVQICNPLLDGTVEFDDTTHDQVMSLKVRSRMSTVSQKVSQTIRSGSALTADNVAGMQQTIDEMMQMLADDPVTLAMVEQSGGWNDYLQEHSANVFYLSMVIGNTIRNYIKKERERLSASKRLPNAMNIAPLGTAALLHDIAMVPLEPLYHKNGELTPQELEQVKKHPHQGAELLPSSIDPMVRLVIRCHHENQNGTGYPQGLSGEKITIFARIIRAADAYSAAIAHKVYHRAKSSVQVLYEMIYGDHRHFFDPVVMKVFAGIVQPFPIGAKLRLNNGKIAVVTKHNKLHPFKPEVIIAFDKDGQPLSEDALEGPYLLTDREDLEIQTYNDEDISYLSNIETDDEQLTPQEAESLVPQYKDMMDLAYP